MDFYASLNTGIKLWGDPDDMILTPVLWSIEKSAF
jgi:hypothetical protein